MNYYQHHIGDFIRDTSRMSDSQCMAYLRMIWHYYDTEQPLDSDIDALAFSIGANAKDVELILKHYFFQHEGRWHNARCDKEILAFRAKSQKAKDSANARWDNANAMRTQSGRNANAHKNDANQEPVTNNQEPSETKRASRAGFDPILIHLSNGLSPDKWKEWVEYRRKRKLTVTEQTMRKQSIMLAKCIENGHDANAIIEASITNGWQGLFEPKPGPAKSGKQSARESYAAQAAEARAQQEGGNGQTIDGECRPVAD